MSVRVRFAPSPTGALHIGGVRTALYNYLFAMKNGGAFILRIEDTDQTRFVEGAEDYIERALSWAGIKPDEGVNAGGEYGPYRQSERKGRYAQFAQQLIDQGKAYYAFDTAEELDEMRERLKEARVANPQYNAVTRMQMKNSLTLTPQEVEEKITSGEPYVIRIKLPRNEDIRFKDIVRGWVVVNTATLDDKVLLKSDGMPTYHLANIVDDHQMEITHVIRGEEWLPSAPLHVILYEYLGWSSLNLPTCPFCLNLMVTASLASGRQINWVFRYSRSTGTILKRMSYQRVLGSQVIYQMPLSIFWHFWDGTPEEKGRSSLWKNSLMPLAWKRSIRQGRDLILRKPIGLISSI